MVICETSERALVYGIDQAASRAEGRNQGIHHGHAGGVKAEEGQMPLLLVVSFMRWTSGCANRIAKKSALWHNALLRIGVQKNNALIL